MLLTYTAWVVCIKDKKGETFTRVFQKIVEKPVGSLHKYLDKNLKENSIELYLTYNVAKSAIAERFIQTLKNKVDQYIAATENVYINELQEINSK